MPKPRPTASLNEQAIQRAVFEWDETGGPNDATPDALIPNPHLSTKPGQVHRVDCAIRLFEPVQGIGSIGVHEAVLAGP